MKQRTTVFVRTNGAYRFRLMLILIALMVGMTGTSSLGAQGKPKGTSEAAIVFWADRDNNRDIYVINADGTGEQRLTTDPAEDIQPSWSPDRERIVFTSNRNSQENPEGGPNFGIWVMNADGSNQRAVVADGEYYERPRWSPDGRQLVYVTDKHGTLDLYTINIDGTNPQRLTDLPGDELDPAWSPNGDKIVYSAFSDNNPLGLYLYDIRNGQSEALLENPDADYASPSWSQDGAQIAYSSTVYDAQGNYATVSVMELATNETTDLTTINEQIIRSTSWAPDDTGIAYELSDPAGRVGTIQIYNLDTQGVSQLQTSSTASRDPNWALPEGSAVFAQNTGGNNSTSGTSNNATTRQTQTERCPNVLPSRLVAGDSARVTLGGRPNNVRNGPGTGYSRIAQLQPGATFEVLSGPECDDYAWYEIDYGNGIGWTAEADSSTYWIELYDPSTSTSSSGSGSSGSGGGSLLNGGRGRTNGATMNAGNFQVEYYCSGVRNDRNYWYCGNGARLGQGDFDRICRDTYNNPQAYARQTGGSSTPAYNWRCYG